MSAKPTGLAAFTGIKTPPSRGTGQTTSQASPG